MSVKCNHLNTAHNGESLCSCGCNSCIRYNDVFSSHGKVIRINDERTARVIESSEGVTTDTIYLVQAKVPGYSWGIGIFTGNPEQADEWFDRIAQNVANDVYPYNVADLH
jgi:hypothetical protein